jgi:hypothetical protein
VKPFSTEDDALTMVTRTRNRLRVFAALAVVAGIDAVVFTHARLLGVVLIVIGVDVLILAGSRARYLTLRATAGALRDQVPPVEQIDISRVIDASAQRAWKTITDHELYGRVAPNLARVEALTADGPGLERRCYDSFGRGWSETCTLWDEGHQFAVEVDTSDYPYPLAMMRGTWWAEPVDERRTRVGMRFQFQPRPGLRGRLFAVVMQVAFRPVIRRIIRGWEREVADVSEASSRR